MRVKFYNLRLSCSREGIEIFPLPTIHCILNEYGERFKPNWEIRIRWIWYCISIRSSKCGKEYSGMLRKWLRKAGFKKCEEEI